MIPALALFVLLLARPALLLALGFILHPALVVALFVALATAAAIDLAPLVNGVLVPLLTPILSAAFLWVAYKVAALLHFNIQSGQRDVLETAIANGINYAGGKLAVTPMALTTTNGAIATVASYVLKTAPGAVAALGLDKDASALAAAITARLPQP